MNRIALFLAALFISLPAYAQVGGGVTSSGAITAGHCVQWLAPNVIQDSGSPCGGGGSVSITAGSTNIVVSPSPLTGTGTIDLASSPTVSGTMTAAIFNATTAGTAYEIGGAKILFLPDADTSSIAVGSGSFAAYALTTNGNNTGIGNGALAVLTTGLNNTAVGFQAGNAVVTDQAGTFIGYQAGKFQNIGNSTTGGNTAIGYQALVAVTTQIGDTAVGYRAGNAATTGNGLNSFFGWGSGTSVTTGVNNTFLGANAVGGGNVTANTIVGEGSTGNGTNNNVVIGQGASANSQSNNSTVIGEGASAGSGFGDSSQVFGFGAKGASGTNTVIGYLAGSGNGGTTSGTGNVLVGERIAQSSQYNTSNNTAVGYQALNTITTGGNNTVYGYQAGFLATTATGDIIIGYNSGNTVLTVGNNDIIVGNSLDVSTSSTSNTFLLGQGAGNIAISCTSLNTTTPTCNFPGTLQQAASAVITTAGTGLVKSGSTLSTATTGTSGVPLVGSAGTPTCGTGCASITSGSTDSRGSMVTSSSVSSAALNFSTTLGFTPVCTISDSNTSAVADISSLTSSALTVSMASALSTVTIYWICVQ